MRRNKGIVTPQVIGFGLSAELVIWAAVGGRASLFGPVIGTLLVGSLTAQLRDTLPFWEVLMALFFIAIVLVFPRGVAGLAEPLLRRFPPRRRKQAAIVAPGDPAARPPAKLALDDVSVHVGEVTILDRLSVDFEQAGIFCVIGPNGAGKTSMFNAVSGELGAASGRIGLGGVMTSGLAPHRVSALGVARKLQIPSVFPDLSIADNLAVALWSGRAGKLALLDPRLRRWTSPMLKELQSRYPFLAAGARKAAELSHGEQQILELAMALLTEPRVLLLDEPCAGLSPEETAAAMEIIRWAQQRLGGAIIIIEHDMSLVKELAQIVYVLHNGALLAQGQRGRDPSRPGGARGLCRRREVSRPRLRFEDLTGGYGSTTIVRDLSGAAIAGEALCVLGRNGVGKTTLMKLLTGYLPCMRGRVLLDEQPITALDPAARRRAGVSYCPQERPVFDDLSVRDNLTLMGESRKLAPFRRYFDRFPILERRLDPARRDAFGRREEDALLRSRPCRRPAGDPARRAERRRAMGKHPAHGGADRREEGGRRRVHCGRAEPRLRRAHCRPLPDHGPGPHHAGRIALRDRAEPRARASARLNKVRKAVCWAAALI